MRTLENFPSKLTPGAWERFFRGGVHVSFVPRPPSSSSQQSQPTKHPEPPPDQLPNQQPPKPEE